MKKIYYFAFILLFSGTSVFCQSNLLKKNEGNSCEAKFSYTDSDNAIFSFINESLISLNDTVQIWSWYFDDNNFSNREHVSHKFTSSGWHKVILQLTTALGCSSLYIDSVFVSPDQIEDTCKADFNYNTTSPETSLTLSFYEKCSTNGELESLQWTFGNGQSSNEKNPTQTYSQEEKYDVCLYMKTKGGCESQICKEIVLKDTLKNESDTCSVYFLHYILDTVKKEVSFSKFVNGGVESLTWDFGDGQTSTESSPVHTYNDYGEYTACLSVTTLNNCKLDTCEKIIIPTPQEPDTCKIFFSYETNKYTVSFTEEVNRDIDSVFWDFGDGKTYKGLSPSHTYKEPGTYQVCAYLATITGCTSSYCQTIMLEDTTSADTCSAYFTYYISDTTDSSVIISFNEKINVDIEDLSWNFGDGSFYSGSNPIHTYTKNGTYQVCLTTKTEKNGYICEYCESITINIDTTSSDTCKAFFTYQTEGTSKKVYFFDKTEPGKPVSQMWSFGDSTYSYEQNPVHTYKYDGVYNVCLTVNSSNEYSDTYCKRIEIQSAGPADSLSLQGSVFAGQEIINNGFIILFKKTDTDWELAEFNVIQNGFYSFRNIAKGKYKIYAIPDFTKYSKYLPTFYVNKLFWEDANEINVYGIVGGVDIQLQSLADWSFDGDGKISGTIETMKATVQNSFIPVTGTKQAVLRSQKGEIIAIQELKNNTFSFENLSYNTYYIEIWESGVQTFYSDLTNLNEENPKVDEITLKAGKTSTSFFDTTEKITLKTYPNPGTDFITIETNLEGIVNIKIFDATGRLVKQTQESIDKLIKNFSIQDLPDGQYILNIKSKDKIINSLINKH